MGRGASNSTETRKQPRQRSGCFSLGLSPCLNLENVAGAPKQVLLQEEDGAEIMEQFTRKPSPTKVIHCYRELVERGGEAGTSPEDSCSASCASFLFPQGILTWPVLVGTDPVCIALMKGA